MASTESMRLRLAREFYYEGQVVSGVCEVEIPEDSQLPFVELKFRGVAYVHFEEKESKNGTGLSTTTNTYTAIRKLFEIHAHKSTPQGKLASGLHRIPFSFEPPQRLQPSSLEGEFGFVRYQLEAHSPPNSTFQIKAVKDVKVLQRIDTSLPQYQFPVADQDETKNTSCFGCLASAPVFMEAKTDKTAYCPGDVVSLTATFRNNSSKSVKPFAKFVQERVFQGSLSNSRNRSKSIKTSWNLEAICDQSDKAVDTENYEVIQSGSSADWNGKRFRLPLCLPSVSCGRIIEVTYHIEIGLIIPWAKDLVVRLPVVIGTIQLKGLPATISQISSIAGRQNLPFSKVGPPPPAYFKTVYEKEQSILSDDVIDYDTPQLKEDGEVEVPSI